MRSSFMSCALMAVILLALGCNNRQHCQPGARRCEPSGKQSECLKGEFGDTDWSTKIWCTDRCVGPAGQDTCEPLLETECPSTPRLDLSQPDGKKIDVNKDGITDVLFISSSSTERGIMLARGRPAGGFLAPELVIKEARAIYEFQASDIDADGLVDVVVLVRDQGLIPTFQRGDGQGGFSLALTDGPQKQLEGSGSVSNMFIANLDGVPGNEVLVSQSIPSRSTPFVMVGHWNSSVLVFSEATGLDGQWIFGAADIEGLGRDQLLAYEHYLLRSYRLEGATFQGRTLASPEAVAVETGRVSDLNGDGRPEVIFSGLPIVVVTSSRKGGPFVVVKSSPPFYKHTPGLLQDINGDGVIDMLGSGTAGNNGNLGIDVSLGRKDFTFLPPQLMVTKQGANRPLAVADFDGDGVPDLLAQRSTQIGTEIPVVVSGKCQAFQLTPQ
jgi:hypothetical protein